MTERGTRSGQPHTVDLDSVRVLPTRNVDVTYLQLLENLLRNYRAVLGNGLLQVEHLL